MKLLKVSLIAIVTTIATLPVEVDSWNAAVSAPEFPEMVQVFQEDTNDNNTIVMMEEVLGD